MEQIEKNKKEKTADGRRGRNLNASIRMKNYWAKRYNGDCEIKVTAPAIINLNRILKKNRISKKEFAEMMGCSVATVNNRLSSGNQRKIAEMAKCLGCGIEEITKCDKVKHKIIGFIKIDGVIREISSKEDIVNTANALQPAKPESVEKCVCDKSVWKNMSKETPKSEGFYIMFDKKRNCSFTMYCDGKSKLFDSTYRNESIMWTELPK